MIVSPNATRTASANETAGELRRLRRELHEVCAAAEPRFHEYISWATLTVDAAIAHVDGLAGVGPDFKLHTNAGAVTVSDGNGKRAGKQSRNGPVKSARVEPEVWRSALELAGGDANRLRVVSVTEVIILNTPRGKK